ncbi:hypothetical protein KAR91_22275 [Candidatus Pacearchaeota archaeon]|nr:hypothetical protein [Candidatus Pacearchaeota archaeon]
MTLPYSDSKANPEAAKGRITSALRKFGVDRISFEEDYKEKVIRVAFQHKDLPVSIPLDYGALGKLYLEERPYASNCRGSKADYEAKKGEVAYRASFSILEDLIKGLVVVAECGMVSFEEAFLAFFLTPGGQTVGEMLTPRIKEITSGNIALPAGHE